MPAVLGTKLRRVARFFGITDQEYAYWLSQIIVPIFDVAPYVRRSKGVAVLDVAVGGIGPVTLFTVPSNKRWTIHAIEAYRESGTWSMLATSVQGADGVGCVVYSQTTFANLYTGAFAPVCVDAGGTIVVYVDSYAVAGTVAGRVWIDEEDA